MFEDSKNIRDQYWSLKIMPLFEHNPVFKKMWMELDFEFSNEELQKYFESLK